MITNGLQTGVNAAGQATFGIMGTSITATTAQAIATAGTGIAMGNALPAIQAQADVVAPDHNNEGVAWAVQRFVLEPA